MASKEEVLQDLWGHSTQKANYDIYRPAYPQFFFQNIVDLIPPEKRGSFLDIATGTGAFFFPLCPHFSGLCLGIDMSENQLEVASKKIKESMKNVALKVMDVHRLSDYLKEQNISKFDLVTIAQGLHWFDVPFVLKMIKANILAENGLLSLQGYFCLGFEYNVKDESKGNLGYERYKSLFYSIIDDYWDCDRKGLENSYASYPLKEIFGKVEKIETINKHETSVLNLKGYLQTFSSYNTYCDKLSKTQGFTDPIESLIREIEKDLITFQPEEFVDAEKPIKIVVRFFQFNLWNE